MSTAAPGKIRRPTTAQSRQNVTRCLGGDVDGVAIPVVDPPIHRWAWQLHGIVKHLPGLAVWRVALLCSPSRCGRTDDHNKSQTGQTSSPPTIYDHSAKKIGKFQSSAKIEQLPNRTARHIPSTGSSRQLVRGPTPGTYPRRRAVDDRWNVELQNHNTQQPHNHDRRQAASCVGRPRERAGMYPTSQY